MSRRVQDTIQFDLKAEQVVTNDTVRITAQLVGMILTETAESAVRESIRTLMKKFIDTDWQYSNMVRSSHASGREQITLTATARVPESEENYALDRRREEAGRDSDSMRIVSATVDTSPTAGQIEETQRKLRLEILKKAQDEQKLINEAMGDKYRLGQIVFQAAAPDNAANYARGITMAASTAPYGSGFADSNEDDTIGNAVKMTMQANVQLRVSRQ